MDQMLFLYRLQPPRPDFPQDITSKEAILMQAHAAFWQDLLATGQAVVFGPVADPAGIWGLGVVRAANETAARAIVAGDPALRPGMGFGFGLFAMPRAVAR